MRGSLALARGDARHGGDRAGGTPATWGAASGIPNAAVAPAVAVARLPLVPAQAQWLNAFRVPVLMSTAEARRELRWRPATAQRGRSPRLSHRLAGAVFV
jgi:hypothetical protein